MMFVVLISLAIVGYCYWRSMQDTRMGIFNTPLPKDGYLYYTDRGDAFFMVKRYFTFRAYPVEDLWVSAQLPEDFCGRSYIRTNARSAFEAECYLSQLLDILSSMEEEE